MNMSVSFFFFLTSDRLSYNLTVLFIFSKSVFPLANNLGKTGAGRESWALGRAV